jgi:uncharacterized protein YkwD
MLLRYCLKIAILVCLIVPAIGRSQANPVSSTASDNQIFLPMVMMSEENAAVAMKNRVVELMNAQRVAHGCMPLTVNPHLTAAAQRHSVDMALNDFFSHIGSDGSTMDQRMRAAGYIPRKYAENVSAGQDTPEAVVATLMASPSHRASILDCELQEVGIGYYHQPDDQYSVLTDDRSIQGPFFHYWTQDFATPAS